MSRTVNRQREKAISKLLMVLAAMVLVAGLAFTIVLNAKVRAQKTEIASVEKQIQTLNADILNLNLVIDKNHNLSAIESRAEALGMVEIDESRVRVVTLYQGTSESTQQALVDTD